MLHPENQHVSKKSKEKVKETKNTSVQKHTDTKREAKCMGQYRGNRKISLSLLDNLCTAKGITKFHPQQVLLFL